MIGTLEIRHPKPGEVPAELMEGFEAYKINPEWQWVAVADGKVVAQLLGSDMHGVFAIWRLKALKSAPNGWAVALLRGVLEECRERGMIGYLTFLTDNSRVERRLMRIIQRAGGYIVPAAGAWCVGRLNTRY